MNIIVVKAIVVKFVFFVYLEYLWSNSINISIIGLNNESLNCLMSRPLTWTDSCSAA